MKPPAVPPRGVPLQLGMQARLQAMAPRAMGVLLVAVLAFLFVRWLSVLVFGGAAPTAVEAQDAAVGLPANALEELAALIDARVAQALDAANQAPQGQ